MSAAAAAKSLQLSLTLCNPIDGSLPGSPIPGILQARILEWVAISFSNEWKWKVKVKTLSHVRLLATPWTAAYKAPPSMGFSRQEYYLVLNAWIGTLTVCPWPSYLTYLCSNFFMCQMEINGISCLEGYVIRKRLELYVINISAVITTALLCGLSASVGYSLFIYFLFHFIFPISKFSSLQHKDHINLGRT